MVLQAKRIADYIGSYYIRLKGLDALVFTAGIGENSGEIRSLIVGYLEVLGIKLDDKLNNTRSVEGEISSTDSKVKVWVIPTNEELVIASDAFRIHNAQ